MLFNLADDERERANRATAEPERLAAMRLLWDGWNREMLPYPAGAFTAGMLARHFPDRY
jgi:hypothetical protein